MLTEQNLPVTLQIIDPINQTATLTLTTAILRNGVEIAREAKAMTFQCDQMEYVKIFLGVTSSPEIDYLNSIWTEDFIETYHNSQVTS